MTVEETKDELYRLLSDCVNGAYPLRNNAQRGRYRKAVGVAIRSLDAWDDVQKISAEIQEEKDNISFDINEEKAKWVNSGIHDGLSLAQEIISRYREVEE